MADRFFQCLCARTVLHGQIHTYLGNIHIGHDAAYRKLLGIRKGRGECPSLRDRRIGQHGVILLRRLPLGSQFGIVGVLDGRGVDSFYIGVVLFAHQLTDQWIEK